MLYIFIVIPDLLLVLLILNAIVNLDWISNKIVKLLKDKYEFHRHFKGKNLVALIAAVIVCVLLSVFGAPKIAIYVVMFALGCNNKNFAQWVEEKS